jgi:hypothetical protein
MHNKIDYCLKKEHIRNKNRNYFRDLREKTIIILGGKCVICGFNNFKALQISQINENITYKGKYNEKQKFYKYVIQSVDNGNCEFQLICANCNSIKRYSN